MRGRGRILQGIQWTCLRNKNFVVKVVNVKGQLSSVFLVKMVVLSTLIVSIFLTRSD